MFSWLAYQIADAFYDGCVHSDLRQLPNDARRLDRGGAWNAGGGWRLPTSLASALCPTDDQDHCLLSRAVHCGSAWTTGLAVGTSVMKAAADKEQRMNFFNEQAQSLVPMVLGIVEFLMNRSLLSDRYFIPDFQ